MQQTTRSTTSGTTCESQRDMTAQRWPDEGDAAPLDLAVAAMCQAADRVARVSATEAAGAFAAIGEVLWWVSVVDDNVKTLNQSLYQRHLEYELGDRPLLLALRYARNRFTHQVDVLEYIQPDGVLHDDPRGYVTLWRWQSLQPEQWDKKGGRARRSREGYEAYQRVLAGGDVHQSLVNALSVLRGLAWSPSLRQGRLPTPEPPNG